MDTILNDICVLVTSAFALTLVPGFTRPERSLLSRRDQGTALLVFLVLGLVEEVAVSHAGLLNERIVTVCAAGLVAGPWVGLAVGVFVTWLAVVHHGLPFGSTATSMLCGGLAGGWLHRWRPKLAQHPLTGFCLTLGISLLRSGLIFWLVRVLVPLDEELAVVRAYLDIESLRFGDRLKVEQTIDPDLLKVRVPPFSFQPLVENAVEHGLGSSLQAGRLRLVVRATGPWLEMSVSDDGQGVPSTEVEQLFFAERQPVHVLTLLRRRLKTLFGRSYQLEVRSEIGEGTRVAMRIPLQARFEVTARSLETGGQDTGQMAPNN